jgi:Flp pilus assembly protein TadB
VIVGAVAFGLGVCCGALALRGPSRVEARLTALATATRRRSAVRAMRGDATATRFAGALVGLVAATVMSTQLSLGVLPIPIAGYLGWIVPAILAARRSARRQRAAEHGVVTLVEWLHALVSTGRPLETAIDTVAQRGLGDRFLDDTLARVRRDYTLGVPMHRALEMHGSAADLKGVVEIAARTERAREMGRGVLPILQDLRDELRALERARSLEAASHVDGKLTLVLTLCYLPALALLVIIPLFLTLLAGLFG